MPEVTKDQLEAFEKRMEEKRKKEAEAEAKAAEKLREQYEYRRRLAEQGNVR